MSSVQGYCCPECDYTTPYPGLMNEHISSHYLGIVSEQYGSMDQTIKVAKNTDDIEWKYRCNDCKIRFFNEEVMKEHFISEHRQQHKCDHCDFIAETPQGLAGHKKKHSARIECEKCRFKTASHVNMKKHICLPKRDKPVKRDTSPKRDKSVKRDLSVKRGKLQKNNRCNECDRSYSNMSNYNNHLKARKHKCAVVMARHGRIYCNDCEVTFKDIKKFAKHIRYTHPSVYLLICDKCCICEVAHNKDEVETAKTLHAKYCEDGTLTVLEAEKRRK